MGQVYRARDTKLERDEFFREAQWTLPEQLGQTDANQQSPRQNFARSFGGSTQSLESLVAISHFQDGELAEVGCIRRSWEPMALILDSGFLASRHPGRHRKFSRGCRDCRRILVLRSTSKGVWERFG